MIELQGIYKYYGDRSALIDVSFKVDRGEIVGLLGPNGAGKTTCLRIITGFMPPTKGTCRVCEIDVIENPIEVKKRVGYLPENPPLYNDMTTESYLKFVGGIKRLSGKKLSERLGYVMERCGLSEVRKRLVGNLSRGYRQRVGLAQAIIHEPEVLILDEPTVGLDPEQVVEVRELIKEIAEEHTVIISTHILPEVTRLCSRVIMISAGKIVAQEDLEKLSRRVSEEFITVVKLAENGKGYEILSSLPNTKVEKIAEGIYKVRTKDDLRKEISKKLFENGLVPVELYEEKLSLEDIYLKIVGEVKE